MEFTEAVERRLPLQIRLPSRRNPLELECRCVAESFVVETSVGLAVVWLEPFWSGSRDQRASRIAYARPVHRSEDGSWRDEDPQYGPYCLAYQRPFVAEPMTASSPVWREYQAWQAWLRSQGEGLGTRQAWLRVAAELEEVNPKCLVPRGVGLEQPFAQAEVVTQASLLTASPSTEVRPGER